ncbi:MAG TPA: hypothetical protein GXZ82_08435 [Firmicutes bacterium]|jgi:hypothetical protein|nr:hypothetical protein [Bacillota bacterium]
MKARHVVLMVSVLLLVSATAFANNYMVYAPKVQAPVLDGKLDDAAWLEASIVGGKAVIDMSNTVDRLTPFPRVAYVAYDDANLYIAYSIYTANPDGLITSGAAPASNDEVEVFLQPAGRDDYIQAMVDAGGMVRVPTYNLQFAIGKTPIQWIVEMAIPFSEIGSTPKSGDVWKINFAGRQLADGDTWVCWSPTYGSFKQPQYFGSVTFK